MEEELDHFLQYDKKFTEGNFYEELSALGKTMTKTVDAALSILWEFLRDLRDVDGIFQATRIDCIGLASDTIVFVKRGTIVSPAEARKVMKLRDMLTHKFLRMKGSWENLLWAVDGHDVKAVLHKTSELAEVMEGLTNEALFGLRDLLWSLQDRDLGERVGTVR